MAIQESVAVRNAKLNAIETAISTDPVFEFRTGSPPANCAAANTGTLLAQFSLPTDWMAAASGGSKGIAGSWTDPSANAAGTVGHFRIFATDGTTCHMQGTVSESGGGGDMIIQNDSIEIGQVITVVTFTLTEGNA